MRRKRNPGRRLYNLSHWGKSHRSLQHRTRVTYLICGGACLVPVTFEYTPREVAQAVVFLPISSPTPFGDFTISQSLALDHFYSCVVVKDASVGQPGI